MIPVKSVQDIASIGHVSPQHHDILKDELVKVVTGFDPDTQGFAVYLSKGDAPILTGEDGSDDALLERFRGIYFSDDARFPKWENVRVIKEDEIVRFFVVYVVINNDNCMAYYIPNESWVPENLRTALFNNVGP